MMFRGATKVTIDAKGRLAIPTRYRERLESRSNGQLVVTVDGIIVYFCMLFLIGRKLNEN